MPGVGRFVHRAKEEQKKGRALVLVDCNTAERAGLDSGDPFGNSIVIDHHETEKDYGDLRWVDPSVAATGLMIYEVVKRLGIRSSKSMAVNLYTAIAVDTGTFRYGNTTADVLTTAAELVRMGAEPHVVADNLYENWDRKRFELLLTTLNTMEIREGVAMTHITKDVFRKTGTGSEDTENFSNYPRMINSVRVSALLREMDKGVWRASLRSKGKANVAEIAECFGGGGHRNAAGFRIEGDLESVKKELLKADRKIRRRR
jgi:phosphoesterase RecJ-like protein